MKKGDSDLTFGEGLRLNHVEESVDYVEEEADGPRLVVSVGVVNRCGHKPEVQRFHRRRGPLPAGVRLNLGRERTPLIRLLLAACGPPAEQQDEPPCPQHGSEGTVFNNKKEKKESPDSFYGEMGRREGMAGENACSSRGFSIQRSAAVDRRTTSAGTINTRGSGSSQGAGFCRSRLMTDISADISPSDALTLAGGPA